MSRRRLVRAALAALVVLATLTGSVAAATVDGPVAGDGGYRFDIGGESPHMTFWVHLDMFTNLGKAGDFGFSAVGTAMDTRVIAIDVQLRFDGVGPAGEFLQNPFSRFSARAEWVVNIPWLSTNGNDFTYEDNETVGAASQPPEIV